MLKQTRLDLDIRSLEQGIRFATKQIMRGTSEDKRRAMGTQVKWAKGELAMFKELAAEYKLTGEGGDIIHPDHMGPEDREYDRNMEEKPRKAFTYHNVVLVQGVDY